MSIVDDERLARERAETEAEGRKWENERDEYLVGFVRTRVNEKQQNIALAELHSRVIKGQRQNSAIQEKLIVSIDAASDCAAMQTANVITLTNTLRLLTWVLVAVGVVQVLLMLWK
jgi:hypothetical protein